MLPRKLHDTEASEVNNQLPLNFFSYGYQCGRPKDFLAITPRAHEGMFKSNPSQSPAAISTLAPESAVESFKTSQILQSNVPRLQPTVHNVSEHQLKAQWVAACLNAGIQQLSQCQLELYQPQRKQPMMLHPAPNEVQDHITRATLLQTLMEMPEQHQQTAIQLLLSSIRENSAVQQLQAPVVPTAAAACKSLRHQCKFCNKSFDYPSGLVRHERVHTGDSPFECSICCRTFKQQSTLATHFRVHTKEMPFECPHQGCDRCFRHQTSLKRHALKCPMIGMGLKETESSGDAVEDTLQKHRPPPLICDN